MQEGWYKINNEKVYVQKIVGDWKYWSIETGWHKVTENTEMSLIEDMKPIPNFGGKS